MQIGDENVHRVRALMDEVFGDGNYIATITVQKTGSSDQNFIPQTIDYILFYSKDKENLKYRQIYQDRQAGTPSLDRYDLTVHSDGSIKRIGNDLNRLDNIDFSRAQLTAMLSSRPAGEGDIKLFDFNGRRFSPGNGTFKTNAVGLHKLKRAGRLYGSEKTLRYIRKLNDFSILPITDRWESVQLGTGLIYVVQTSVSVLQRCILMATDPGDLVLDPTCGSGTTAYVAEQWGRRWITIDTSRVALALARARIMGARYPYYLLADSKEGQIKEAEVPRTAPKTAATRGSIRQGFVYERVPHITLKSIANNAEIDVIWDKWQETLEPLRSDLNTVLNKTWEEWEIPREATTPWERVPANLLSTLHIEMSASNRNERRIVENLKLLNMHLGRSYTLADLPKKAEDPWFSEVQAMHADWWKARIARQREIDASIAAKAESEFLYDRPYPDNKRVRVAGPFTVESVLPHRTLGVDEHGELIDPAAKPELQEGQSFESMILENLRTAGVQQADKTGRIAFTALAPWPGELVSAEGTYIEGEGDTAVQRRAALLIGPEFGTVQRADLVRAAREAAEAGFDLLIACAFSFEAHTTDFNKLGSLPVLKARMNADLHMGGDLKPTGTGNLFVVFGEPDIELLDAGNGQVQVKVKGVDVFHPSTGEVRSSDADGIACWFVDTNYNEESFFVRHAYFLGAQDPYSALKTTLKAEVDAEAWGSLNSDTSRAFDKPETGRIAVKVINHLGDEVMKVYKVS